MKKFLKSFLLIIFVISFPLILFGCDSEPKTLTTPISVGLVKNTVLNESTSEPETQVLLVTDKNKFAKGYRFYLTDSREYNKIDNYISFYSENNFCDITQYYNEFETYRYFVKYVGDNSKYFDSDYSSIKTKHSSLEKISSPYIQLIDTKIYFFRIMNTKEYELYETITDTVNNEIIQENSFVTTLDNETFEYDLSSRFNHENAPYYTFSYKLKAIAINGYINSDFSNTVSFVKHIKLGNVKNINVEENENVYTLNWDKVDYATKYEVIINNDTENPIVVEDNKLDITNKLTSYSTYNFTVQAVESDVLSYDKGDKSSQIEFDYTTTLPSPDNIDITRNGQYLNIDFDTVTLGQSYTVKILYNDNEIYLAGNVVENTLTIEISELFANLEESKEIKVCVKANKVGEYILESEYSEKLFTILVDTTQE